MSTAITNTQQDSTDTSMARYMWVITVQWPTGGGFGNATFSSTVDVPPGASRMDVYMQIFELAKRETRVDKLMVLFFALEPDRLAA
ncbi:hypothetical protein [Nonomuraea sp. bgisy101]|uniref:hypothetical protein n=1 Tax=Nonomuraea sp. bgisy101 TaxID=3413784 RepID=UPI003D736F53